MFFIYLLLINGSRDVETQIWVKRYGGGVFFIGLLFFAIAYFMLKRHKKKHGLQGIGYAAYMISCIAIIIFLIMIVLAVFMAIFTLIAPHFALPQS